MAKNWVELEVRMVLREDREARRVRELLGKPLDEEDSEEVIYNPVMIDLETVTSFSPLYREDGSADEGKSEIVTIDGGFLTVNKTYTELIQLICK